ncbi:MAG: aspartyl protease family protein [Candidatus Woesearchaeota archaeon]
MTLTYKFKKEKLENGLYATRPRIMVTLVGPDGSLDIPALLDSGCDITVIPEGIARALSIEMDGKRNKLFAHRESSDTISSKVNIIFQGKVERQSVRLNNVPILVCLEEKGIDEESDIVLGVDTIFDHFDITFKKSQNKIIMKEIEKVKLKQG